MRYYLIAGEASGDLHGSNLIKGLLAEDPKAEIRFWGGDLMLASGGTLVKNYKEGAVMGFTEVLVKGFKLLSNIKFCKQDILSWKPDVVILIDYPGFNMRIAKFCHESHIKVFYYIAPKTWASRDGRNRKLKAWVDKLFIVFPFEVPYFSDRQIPFVYEGNPLLDAVASHHFTKPIEGRYLAILAGSRKAEISKMMPVCMEVVSRLELLPQYANCRFVIAGAPSRSREDYLPYMQGRDNVEVIFNRTYDILRFADAAIINSGTASLEAALISTPQVVCWSTSALTYLLAIYLLKIGSHIKYISLGNLCIDKAAWRELIQDDFNTENLTAEVRRLVEDEQYRSRMISDYNKIRVSLGESGASGRIAHAMIEELSRQ